MLATALLVLCSAAVALCGAGRSSDGFLSSLSQADQKLDAEYFSTKARLGITVSSSEENLLVKSSSGKVLVNFEKPLYKVGNDMDQLVVVNGKPFLDHRRTAASSYSITDEDVQELMTLADELEEEKDQGYIRKKVDFLVDNIIKNAMNNDHGFHKQAVHKAITDLINDPHTPVIVAAAITMGKQKRIIGSDYPPVLPFYAIAKLLSNRLNNPQVQERGKNSLSCSPVLAQLFRKSHPKSPLAIAIKQDKAKATCFPYLVCDMDMPCYYDCPPCPYNECLGMCGAGCDCWDWFCGDCCWHKGCCIHDSCCDMHGFFSMPCFNVLTLTCEDFYCPLV